MTDEQNPAPEDQDTPEEEKLYAGKFKSPEELAKAYEDSVRGYTQMAEENDRMTRYIAMMDQPVPPQQNLPTNSSSDYEAYEDGQGQPITPEVQRYIDQKFEQQKHQAKTASDLERQFFSNNPDLKGQEDLVLFHTMKLKQERAGLPPLSAPALMEEVAKRARTQIETIRGNGKTPPHVEGGSRGERPPTPKGIPMPTEEERLREAIDESRARRARQLSGKG